MTDPQLEQRLRAWYAAQVPETEAAPQDLRASLAAIPATAAAPRRPHGRRRGFTLLAVAAVLLVGGAIAAGSGLRLPTVVPPHPSEALVASPGPSPSDSATKPPAQTPAPVPAARPGDLIAFTKVVDRTRNDCLGRESCATARLWLVGPNGQGAHEVFPGGVENQRLVGWSSDGTFLLYNETGTLLMTDTSGSEPQLVPTGCDRPVAPTPSSCQGDSQIAFSRDGRRIVFRRDSIDDAGYFDLSTIATMDLTTGQVATLNPTGPDGGIRPSWSPDDRQIVYSGTVPKGSDVYLPAIFVIDADGQNLHQINPEALGAQDAAWSPDGQRIVFISPRPVGPDGGATDAGDVYTIRPDGTDVRRLTIDGTAVAPGWTADGRILFTKITGGNGDPGWWTMDADGTHAALLLSASAIGIPPESIGQTQPAWQQVGGAATVRPPWTAGAPVAVGPPAPTPAPTPTPALGPGFSFTGPPPTDSVHQFGETATALADGRVLVTATCSTAAQLYDPGTGTFSPTGSMAQIRASTTATLLHDGRVLFVGGYDCGPGGSDGMWASAELYDPATGTFGPAPGSLSAPRSQHTATLLADGRVLIAGGLSGPSASVGSVRLAAYRTVAVDEFLSSAEIYDPASGTFSKTGSMTSPHRGHTATLLADGRVLVIGNGGETSSAGTIADLYDPKTGRFTRTGSLNHGRWLQTATLLPDGRVLVLGGRTSKDSVRASAETYDPTTGTFRTAGTMTEGRQQHTATLLSDGRVFIAGGYWSDGQAGRNLDSTEIYDPATGIFTPSGPMGAPRSGHSAANLADGRILLVGGEDPGDRRSFWAASSVLFQP